MRRNSLIAAAALTIAAALTGCSTAAAPTGTPTSTIPALPSTPAPAGRMLDTAATSDVGVAGYDLGGYNTTTDSGFRYPQMSSDAFPAGSYVAAFRITITGGVPFAAADITGMNLTGTHFDDSTSQAVLDTHSGPGLARHTKLPFGDPHTLSMKKPWRLKNGVPYSFAVAYYVPAGARALMLTITVPSQAAPMILRLPVGSE
ncbi:hypothetical protein ACIRCZ_19460 [Leifsonia sp. NPDC102414]|uniref:hypothetical protein n=1 Tax=Leifsonia sp. NPDC102414 TaxID=3364124 RepID=UPI0037F107B0